MFQEITHACCTSHAEHINTLRGLNADGLYITQKLTVCSKLLKQ